MQNEPKNALFTYNSQFVKLLFSFCIELTNYPMFCIIIKNIIQMKYYIFMKKT
jgi:hypothetical protein